MGGWKSWPKKPPIPGLISQPPPQREREGLGLTKSIPSSPKFVFFVLFCRSAPGTGGSGRRSREREPGTARTRLLRVNYGFTRSSSRHIFPPPFLGLEKTFPSPQKKKNQTNNQTPNPSRAHAGEAPTTPSGISFPPPPRFWPSWSLGKTKPRPGFPEGGEAAPETAPDGGSSLEKSLFSPRKTWFFCFHPYFPCFFPCWINVPGFPLEAGSGSSKPGFFLRRKLWNFWG